MDKDSDKNFKGRDPSPKDLPERPLECSGCKKEITVRYTEIESDTVHETVMCHDCPELQKHLKGCGNTHVMTDSGVKTDLACGDCGTTFDFVRAGHHMGCSHCYEVFGESVAYELQSMGKLPPHVKLDSHLKTLHVGRSLGEFKEVSPSLRLIALKEALDETLKKEDYEQAALLRDQINELSEKSDLEDIEEKDGKK